MIESGSGTHKLQRKNFPRATARRAGAVVFITCRSGAGNVPDRRAGGIDRAGLRRLAMRRNRMPTRWRAGVCRRRDSYTRCCRESLRSAVPREVTTLTVHKVVLLVEREIAQVRFHGSDIRGVLCVEIPRYRDAG